MFVRSLFLCLLAVGSMGGKPDDKDKAKQAAVRKVIDLMENLRNKVSEEGEQEAKSYNAFACWCKSTLAEKSEFIEEGDSEMERLGQQINADIQDRDQATETHQDKLDSIKEFQEAYNEEEEHWKVKAAQMHKLEKDLLDTAHALGGAVDELRHACGGGEGSYIQKSDHRETFEKVKSAMLIADSLGVEVDPRHISNFMQLDGDYKCHQEEDIDMFQGLEEKFVNKEADVEKEEEKKAEDHNLMMQHYANKMEEEKVVLNKAKETMGKKDAALAAAYQRMSELNAQLLTDKEFTTATAKECQEKAKTWEKRQQVRVDELSALTEAMQIVKEKVLKATSKGTVRLLQNGATVQAVERVAQNPDAMEAIEAAAEQAESFLSLSVVRSEPSNAHMGTIVDLLRSKGTKMKSTVLTSLAGQIASLNSSSKDPFAKIKVLIEELVKRLLDEAANEANQKGFCDKATADAEQKRDTAAEKVADLNTELAEAEANLKRTVKKLTELDDKLATLEFELGKAERMREEEKTENTATIEEAKIGKEAVEMAIDILSKFYKKAGKSFAEVEQANGGSKVDPKPDAGFDNGEDYEGAQGESGGILGMMDVIKSDFARTISVTKEAEADAKKEMLEFSTETESAIKQTEVAIEENRHFKQELNEQIEKATDDLTAQTDIMNTGVAELLELKPTCVDTGMSYKERVARREDEISSLKQALCILSNSDKADAAAEC